MKQGWEIKKLGEVCVQITDGSHFSPKSSNKDEYPYITVRDIIDDRIDFANCKYINEESYELLKKNGCQPNKGDLLFSKDGTVGKVSLVDFDKDFVVLSSLAIIRVKQSIILPSLMRYILKNPNFLQKAIGMKTGVAIRRIILKNLKLIDICFPKSLPEQQRIVAILDEAFASIAIAKANAEQNLKNARELFESYLQSIFEKKGTNWISSSIGETCNLLTGGTPSKSRKEYFEGGNIKWLVSGDINQKVIYDCEGRITDLGLENSNARFLPINSVLIALNGQGKTRGTVAMLKTKATCNQSLVAIYPKDEKSLLPELIYSNLEGRYNEIRKITGDSGNDRRGLNMPLIRKIKFSYPVKISEQQNIIQRLDNLRSEAKNLEAIYQQKLNDLEELKKSILLKAFDGELKTV